MKNRVVQIDWRTPFGQISPYIEGKGGIIVIAASPLAAGMNFVEIVQHELEMRKCFTIRIDAVNESTRRAADILHFILGKLSPEVGEDASEELSMSLE